MSLPGYALATSNQGYHPRFSLWRYGNGRTIPILHTFLLLPPEWRVSEYFGTVFQALLNNMPPVSRAKDVTEIRPQVFSEQPPNRGPIVALAEEKAERQARGGSQSSASRPAPTLIVALPPLRHSASVKKHSKPSKQRRAKQAGDGGPKPKRNKATRRAKDSAKARSVFH
ncbi:hypothetical protein BDZ97DRAFT_1916140 [Flammula alnicola]|nr:hypothetical protein BDZ97DRAFT_1916140 [Flammula alnicola]